MLLNKISKLIKKILHDSFFRSSFLLFVSLMIANLFAYIFQITMGRMLTVSTFGTMNALFSIIMFVNLPFICITNYLAKNVSHYQSLGKTKKIISLIHNSYKVCLVGCLVIGLSGLIFSNSICSSLKIQNSLPSIILFIGGAIFIFFSANFGILQGTHNFKMLSFMSLGQAILKYVFSVILVVIGLGLNGVMIGYLLSNVVVSYTSYLPIKKNLKIYKSKIKENYKKSIEFMNSKNLMSIWIIFIANLAFTIISQSDIILIKYWFTPYQAGIFSSASVVCKIVMYLPSTLVISLFPIVASKKAKNESTLGVLFKSLAVTLILSGLVVLILSQYSNFIISLLFGSKFIASQRIITLFAVAVIPMSVIMIIMNYCLAKNEHWFAYVLLFCSFLQIGGFIFFHQSIENFIKVILYANLFGCFILFIVLICKYFGLMNIIKNSMNLSKKLI